MKKLYAIRHGESVANAERAHAGWSDVPLTEKGCGQAERAGRLLRSVAFDRIYVSDLPRAQQTAMIALPNVQFTLSELIREINVGSLSGQLITACEARYGPEYRLNKEAQDFTPYGGENRAMLYERIRRFVHEVKIDKADTIAVFTHDGVLRTLLDMAAGFPLPKGSVRTANCTIAQFEWMDEHLRLYDWHSVENEG